MELQKQQPNQPYQILCDKIFYQRLQTLQDNQSVKLYLFPFQNANKKTINFVILDMIRSKPNQTTPIKVFNQQEFINKCQSLYADSQLTQILVYSFNKLSIQQLLKQQNKKVKITSPDNIKQLNQTLKQCVIITLKLPSQFYSLQDSIFNLQGYKFNPVGKIRQSWSYIQNGRLNKAIFGVDNQKIRNQLSQNKTYNKKQLLTILQIIQSVNTLTNYQNKKSKLSEELSILGQNFIHHQKFITNANSFIPILNYQIQLLCSLGRGQSCKNKIATQNLKSSNKTSINICLNFSEGIAICQNIINSKIQNIFTNPKTQQVSQPINCLALPNMPTKLVNPHMFLKTQFKDKFSQYYIKGLYQYYHYGDHNFNDQGWGCAYRSLQSLLSWFRLQQKLNLLSIPTVPQIQNIIDLIDCTSQQKLSGTNNWIGATQVSWVVKKLTGYDCRILHIKDGKDIVQHAQMFRDHLQNVGTPIMYGGDQYAYSIVGINYSWKLGQIMFLILDPHYNGNDKIEKIIQKKGICWRKPQQMFKKGVFYNFCLPIM